MVDSMTYFLSVPQIGAGIKKKLISKVGKCLADIRLERRHDEFQNPFICLQLIFINIKKNITRHKIVNK